ncbi:MAG: hypothetical protein AAF493_02195 [Pseudomonadota bacterium]
MSPKHPGPFGQGAALRYRKIQSADTGKPLLQVDNVERIERWDVRRTTFAPVRGESTDEPEHCPVKAMASTR